ncbi:MAG TPA: pre-peptidase C-terminal domain-containing protein [Solirubrobacteraceae bacterium]|nr:pre-peptidase C-terminal domain-containing protein [Solirubrobacteraceae bacterium]
MPGVLVVTAVLIGAALAPALADAAGTAPGAPVATRPASLPTNDGHDSPRLVTRLPTTFTGTTIGATLEPNEVHSDCAPQPTSNSVWYSITTPVVQRLAVSIAAGGKLDATLDVYLQQRSQLQPVACDVTDTHGAAAVRLSTTAGATYLIRVAKLVDSDPGAFTINVYVPQPPATPPGKPLPARGVSSAVDRIQNVSQAWAVSLTEGTTYRVNLESPTDGACVGYAFYAPGAQDFDSDDPVLSRDCGGYRLFTPTSTGRYSILVTPSDDFSGIQQYHLELGVAPGSATAPGVLLENYARAKGRLNDGGVDAVELFRFNVSSRSNLDLNLDAGDSADFDLELLTDSGHTLSCACGDSGSQQVERELSPGRYFAVVSAKDGTSGRFTLERESRSITNTSISIAGQTHASEPPGAAVPIRVSVSPDASGPVTITVERFDPVARWLFFRTYELNASNGSASVSFLPPTVGRWRAEASYAGSRTQSPSATGFATLQVAGPLTE